MAIIESALDPRSAEFGTNGAAMEALVTDLRSKLAAAALGGDCLWTGCVPSPKARA